MVEVGTRKLTVEQREIDLTEALAFARLHLAAGTLVGAGEAPERAATGVDFIMC